MFDPVILVRYAKNGESVIFEISLSLYNKTTKGYTPKGTRIAAEQNDLCHSK
jgi:hypothetical protein